MPVVRVVLTRGTRGLLRAERTRAAMAGRAEAVAARARAASPGVDVRVESSRGRGRARGRVYAWHPDAARRRGLPALLLSSLDAARTP